MLTKCLRYDVSPLSIFPQFGHKCGFLTVSSLNGGKEINSVRARVSLVKKSRTASSSSSLRSFIFAQKFLTAKVREKLLNKLNCMTSRTTTTEWSKLDTFLIVVPLSESFNQRGTKGVGVKHKKIWTDKFYKDWVSFCNIIRFKSVPLSPQSKNRVFPLF